MVFPIINADDFPATPMTICLRVLNQLRRQYPEDTPLYSYSDVFQTFHTLCEKNGAKLLPYVLTFEKGELPEFSVQIARFSQAGSPAEAYIVLEVMPSEAAHSFTSDQTPEGLSHGWETCIVEWFDSFSQLDLTPSPARTEHEPPLASSSVIHQAQESLKRLPPPKY